MTEAINKSETLKVAVGDGYAQKIPLRMRIKEAVARARKTVEYVLVDVPGGKVELRPPTIATYRKLVEFQNGKDGKVDPLRTAMGIALFLCFDPDTGESVWEIKFDEEGNPATPADVELLNWFEGQDLTGWLNDLAAKGADALKAGTDSEEAKKN